MSDWGSVALVAAAGGWDVGVPDQEGTIFVLYEMVTSSIKSLSFRGFGLSMTDGY